MKFFFTFMLMLYVPISLSSNRNCLKEKSQVEKNICMLFERDQAIGRLMTEVTIWCANKNKENVKEPLGGLNYSMLLDECMAKKLNDLARGFL